MNLLERDSQLASLAALLDAIAHGRDGACALVFGEAGIGKTAFVRRFVEQHGARCELLRGGCEALFAPRPLGPLADMADSLPPALAAGIHTGQTYNGLFPALLAFLRDRPLPTLLVVEDVHWADEATLDLIKYLGRRMAGARTLLVLTYRDDELGFDHPLRNVLGDLPSDSTHRLALPLLSERAVEQLASQAGRSPLGLYRATDGNPFFVTEALESGPGETPTSVRDAVLARLARLSTPARAVAELVSIVPARVERRLVKTLLGAVSAALDECLDRGMLRAEHGSIAFRHELARQSVAQSLPPGRATTMHAQMFRALRAGSAGKAALARLVHHAERAGLIDEVVKLAPLAAREAAIASAHREASALFALALRHAERLGPAVRVELLEARAHECMLTNLPEQAIDARLAALALCREMGDRQREGSNLGWLARLHLFNNLDPAGHSYAQAAIRVLEPLPPCRELAMAYASMAQVLLFSDRLTEVVDWGERAIALAEALGDQEALIYALASVASAQLRTRDDPAAWEKLAHSLTLALQHGFEDHAARAFFSLQTLALVQRRFLAARTYSEQGIAYCQERDLDHYTARLHIRRAFANIELGAWQEAGSDLARLTHALPLTPMERGTTRFVAALLSMRRGGGLSADRARELREAATQLAAELWFAPTAAMNAEAAWLCGDADAVEQTIIPALKPAIALGESWQVGQLAIWLQRSGRPLRGLSAPVARPYALELTGGWRAAAAEWSQLGCPYHEALAMLAGDEEAMRAALCIFESLGAAPAANIARQRLRAVGARVQRGPHAGTRTDPQGLTRREREVFDLLVEGLSNQAIALRLHRSQRTVEHHVSALLGKLGVTSRAEVIGLGRPGANK